MDERETIACRDCQAMVRELRAMGNQQLQSLERLYGILDERVGELIEILANKKENRTLQWVVIGLLALVFGMEFGIDNVSKFIGHFK